MKHRFIYPLTALLLFLLVVVSCSTLEQSIPANPPVSKLPAYASGISGDFDTCVLRVLQRFYPERYYSIINRNISISEDYLSADIYHTKNPSTPFPQIDTIFKIVNFGVDSGFVVYARDYGIVALTDNGHMDMNDYIYPSYKIPGAGFHPMDELFSLVDMCAFYYLKYDSIIHIPGYVDPDVNCGDFEDVLIAEDALREYNGPYVRMKLDQNYPINSYCKRCVSGECCDGGHVVAGCGPVAMAMLFSYFNYPNIIRNKFINWNIVVDLCATYPKAPYCASQIDVLARVVHSIGLIGSKASDPELGTCVVPLAMITIMSQYDRFSNFDWPNVKYIGDDYIIKIKNRRPIIMLSYDEDTVGGSGYHYFVLDGFGAVSRYKERRYENCGTIPMDSVYYYLVHCNFGWGGLANGYYRYSQGFDLRNGPDRPSKILNEIVSGTPDVYSRYRKVLMYDY